MSTKGWPVHGMLDRLEALPMDALLFQGTDHALGHAVLLRAMRRDELLAQSVAAYQRRVASRGKHQAIV
jgi:hypothetical protein